MLDKTKRYLVVGLGLLGGKYALELSKAGFHVDGINIGFSIFTLIFLYFLRYDLAELYGHEPDFLRMTAIFMTYSLFFQVADVFAAPLQGILRGYKDTKVPFYLGVLAYWGITFPVGFLLEKVTELGPYSYWIGLIASLIVSGLCYQWRLNKIVKRYESQP